MTKLQVGVWLQSRVSSYKLGKHYLHIGEIRELFLLIHIDDWACKLILKQSGLELFGYSLNHDRWSWKFRLSSSSYWVSHTDQCFLISSSYIFLDAFICLLLSTLKSLLPINSRQNSADAKHLCRQNVKHEQEV